MSASSSSGYLYGDINPMPTNVTPYSKIWGATPGQLNVPPSIMQEMNFEIPGYSGLTGSAMSGVQSELSGQLSPSTLMNIGNYAAARGMSLGQPNSPISNEIGLSVTGNTSENLVSQGIGNYNNLTSTLASEQINPALTTAISEQNAVDAASPNPTDASQAYINLINALARPSGAGTGFKKAMGDVNSFTGMLGGILGMVGGGGGGGMMGGMGGGMVSSIL